LLVLDFTLEPVTVSFQSDNFFPLTEVGLFQFQQVALFLLSFLQLSILLLQL